MILKELPENVDALLGEPRVLSALDGISKRYETVIDICEPKAFFTCEDCLVELKWPGSMSLLFLNVKVIAFVAAD